MLKLIAARLVTTIPSLIGVIIVTFLAHAGAARRYGLLFRRTGGHAAGHRRSSDKARPRQAPAATIRRLRLRAGQGRPRPIADHRPAGDQGHRRASSRLGRTDARRPVALHVDCIAAWRHRRRQAGIVDRSSLQGRRHGRCLAAGILHRASARLRVLFSARLVPCPARQTRRVLFRAATRHRLPARRQPDRTRFRGIPRRLRAVDPAGDHACDFSRSRPSPA